MDIKPASVLLGILKIAMEIVFNPIAMLTPIAQTVKQCFLDQSASSASHQPIES